MPNIIIHSIYQTAENIHVKVNKLFSRHSTKSAYRIYITIQFNTCGNGVKQIQKQ